MNILSTKNLFQIVFLCLLLCLTTVLKAQITSEYVITKNGDTIPCKINKPFWGPLKYTPINEEKRKSIKTTTIKEYFYKEYKNPFLVKTVPNYNKTEFVERLEYGAINLYESYKPGPAAPGGVSSRGVTSWYAEKSGKIYHIKISMVLIAGSTRKERKTAFEQLIADDPELKLKFEEDKDYGWKDIRATIISYNRRHPM
jgi:hypothetical protein